MAKIYYELIIRRLKRLDDVPERLREKVASMLVIQKGDALC